MRKSLLTEFFFPSVSGLAIFTGNAVVGIVENRVFGWFDTTPEQVGFTSNSDTPYGPVLLDLRGGPLVIEFPPGPLASIAVDINQRWIADLGGKHLLLPPDWDGEIPDGYHASRATSFRVTWRCGRSRSPATSEPSRR